MTISEALKIFYDTPWGAWARDTPGVFYAAESLHFVGLCFLLGALLLVDLRLIGLWRSLPIAGTFAYVRLALVGFAINLVTGFLMFCADPYNYWTNSVFHIKLILILLAGGNLAWFILVERKRALALPDGADAGLSTKVSAVLSLALWVAIIVAGRLLPSFEGDGGLFAPPPDF
jgi:hypothetical protein